MSYKYLFRIIILGHPGVGKSSLLSRLCDDTYRPTYQPTVGIDFGSTMTYLCQETKDVAIKSHIWDTAGQEYFSPIVRNYYRDIGGAIFIFDITHRQSFERLTYWLDELQSHNKDPVKLVLLGNKTDLISRRVISYQQGKQLAEEHNMEYYEVSVKNNTDIASFYYEYIKAIYETIDETSDILPHGIKKHAFEREASTDIVIPMKDLNCCFLL